MEQIQFNRISFRSFFFNDNSELCNLITKQTGKNCSKKYFFYRKYTQFYFLGARVQFRHIENTANRQNNILIAVRVLVSKESRQTRQFWEHESGGT